MIKHLTITGFVSRGEPDLSMNPALMSMHPLPNIDKHIYLGDIEVFPFQNGKVLIVDHTREEEINVQILFDESETEFVTKTLMPSLKGQLPKERMECDYFDSRLITYSDQPISWLQSLEWVVPD